MSLLNIRWQQGSWLACLLALFHKWNRSRPKTKQLAVKGFYIMSLRKISKFMHLC